MSKQQGKGHKGDKAAAASLQEDLRVKEKLQAIVIADTFEQRFSPLTAGTSPCLLRLANVPVIDYTLELLASSGVQEIFAACYHQADQLAAYIKASPKWSTMVTVVEVAEASSAGDLVREVFNRNLITTTDFILVHGDVVSNVRLDAVLEEHKKRREKDKRCVMTMVMSRAAPRHPCRSLEDETTVALDAATGMLLHYDSAASEPSVEVDSDVFEQHACVSVRYDLVDCGVAVCSQEVLVQFVDNFDYAGLAPDFIKGTLYHSDILNYKLFVHVHDAYAARARDLRTYCAVSKDLLRRWVYPIVPEMNMTGTTSYAISRNLVYKDQGFKTARDAKLEREVMVGSNTSVGPAVFITHSIIGSDCSIGSNARITGSFIGAGVVIGQNVTVVDSIVGDGALLLDGATVQQGCIIGPKTVVGKGFTVEAKTKLIGWEEGEELGDDAEGTVENISLGDGGRGWKFVDSDNVPTTNTLVRVPEDEAIPQEEEEEEEQEEEESGDESSDSYHDDVIDGSESDDESEASDDEEFERFQVEVSDLCDDAMAGDCPQREFELQINSLRFTYNLTARDCAKAVIRHLVTRGAEGKTGQKEIVAGIRSMLKKHSHLTQRYISSESPENEQSDMLCNIQDYCRKSAELKPAFPFIMHALYDCDIVNEGAIFGWEAVQKGPDAKPDAQEFLSLSSKLLEWLRTADEEDDD
eukprot:m51a1_g124 hypothetical protein (696) ;mRNA; f:418414-421333